MSEIKFESKQASTPAPIEAVWQVLSNMDNLNRLTSLIPEDKIKDLSIEKDVVRFKVDGLAKRVGIRIVDREEQKTVKFAAEDLPVAAFFWIQMLNVAPGDTRLKLTIKADMPMMFRKMLEKKMQEGLNQAVDILAQLPYEKWVE